jgi:F-type H+-transporting ATPase subunit a
LKQFVLIFFLLLSSIGVGASDSLTNEEPVDAFGLIMEHISDAHRWHVIDYTNRHGNPVHISMPLPVILWHNNSLWFYSSDDFYHNDQKQPFGNDFVVLKDEHFYITDQSGTINIDETGNITNASPLDFSITKNVASMLLSVALLLLMFLTAAKAYARFGMAPPKGFRAVLEPIILFVRDDIARSQISKEKADKFVPFLLTLFFFIWINNLIGIIPFFPGGSNLSGNISFTATLAIFAFLAINVFAVKDYWKHIFLSPGMPLPIKILLVPLELLGIFTKPFALMIRLFANITAGHIIILSLISIIFIIKSIYIAPVSILVSLVMFMLELLVAVLQAYIFTLLTALFIGMSTTKSEH